MAKTKRAGAGAGARGKATAESMATMQREISVSEFFAKNRHLLGFDNPRKALLTTVKEAVDNSLDACEEAGILPHIIVEIEHLKETADTRYRVCVQDNGPGIVRAQIERIFGSLLYGSKFHRLKMSRGQQGIGISAAGMYGLMTTGKPVRIVSKPGRKKASHEVILKMDTSKNRADVVDDKERADLDELFPEGHGTRVEIELEGKYLKGRASVDEYIELTAIANPHASFTYIAPAQSGDDGPRTYDYPRGVEELPPEAVEILPHPHEIELGTLIQMLERTASTQLGAFFKSEFSRVSPKVAKEICAHAGLTERSWVKQIGHAEAERLFKAIQEVRIMAPPTDCLSPIGPRTLIKGLQKGLKPDFIAVSSRPPAVYRGRPFLIEAGVAYGGNLPGDDSASVHRFANRVPLQYQQSACATFKSVLDMDWKRYGLQQPRGALPVGSLVVTIHMASVWVPFTSESKEAIAGYEEIEKEMRLALQECGRKLGIYLRRRQQMRREGERRSLFERYIGEVAKACGAITGLDPAPLYEALTATAAKKTERADIEMDEEGNLIKAPTKKRRDELLNDETVYMRESPEEAENFGLGNQPARRKAAPQNDDDAEDSQGEVEPSVMHADAEAKPAKKKKKVIVKKVKKKKGTGAQAAGLFS